MNNAVHWVVTAAVICGFLVLDVLTPLAFQRNTELLLMILLGVHIGQLNLIALWAALAPGNLMVRLPWSLLLGVLMWHSMVLGNRLRGQFSLDDAVTLGLVLLAGVVVTQVPLWIAGRAFGWRLISWVDGASEERNAEIRFGLRHILAGMFFLSIALALSRLVLPPGDFQGVDLDGELGVLLPVVALCNLVVTVPCIWGAFVNKNWLRVLAPAWIGYCLLLTGVEYAVLVALLGSPGDGDTLLYMFVLNTAQCITVWGVLLIFRGLGFRLRQVDR